MTNVFEVHLDLNKRCAYSTISVRQGDLLGTTIRAYVTDHGNPVTLDVSACYILMELPDGTHYYRKAATWDDGVAEVTINEQQAASVTGCITNAYFRLSAGGSDYSTSGFKLEVLPDALEGMTPGETYDPLVQQAIDAANAAAAYASGKASEAHTAAVGAQEATEAADEATEAANSAAQEANDAADAANAAAARIPDMYLALAVDEHGADRVAIIYP